MRKASALRVLRLADQAVGFHAAPSTANADAKLAYELATSG